MNLKEKLLDLGIVIDNEYLDKYCELIESHRNDPKIKYKTNRHHIIPKSYYNHFEIKADDSDENMINLNIKEHCFAHYYLAKCGKEKWFIWANATSVERVLINRKWVEINQMDYNEISILINELKEEQARSLPEDTKKLISVKTKEAMNNLENRDILAYWSNKKQSEEMVEKRIEHIRGRKWVHKNGDIRFVKDKELEDLLAQGYEYGSDQHFNKGRKHTQETKEHMSKANKEVWQRPGYKEKMIKNLQGRIMITNGESDKIVWPEEFESYYSKIGYHKGRSYKNTNLSEKGAETISKLSKGKIWITDDIKPMRIYPNEFEKYEKLGYRKGKISKCY